MAKNPTPAKPGNQPAAGKVTADDVEITHLKVRSLQEGFRRAGRAWSTTEETVSVDDFTDAQIKQLMTEPMLVVVSVAIAEAKPAESGEGQ
jgi:hypothetical protein